MKLLKTAVEYLQRPTGCQNNISVLYDPPKHFEISQKKSGCFE